MKEFLPRITRLFADGFKTEKGRAPESRPSSKSIDAKSTTLSTYLIYHAIIVCQAKNLMLLSKGGAHGICTRITTLTASYLPFRSAPHLLIIIAGIPAISINKMNVDSVVSCYWTGDSDNVAGKAGGEIFQILSDPPAEFLKEGG